MRFGQSAEEAAKDTRSSGSGDYMKYLKAGDNAIRVLDEPDKWVWYWEHYNPGGYPFPCTNDRETCPGCTSDDEKMKKASRKIAFNAYDGEYVNVWKVPKTVADKLTTRYERNRTVTDRDFIITQFKKDNGFFDYDVEGQDKSPVEVSKEFFRDPEDLLAAAYDEAWGDSAKTKITTAKVKQTSTEADLQAQINAAKAKNEAKIGDARAGLRVVKTPPVEEKVMTEEELRAMEPWDLVKLCESEGLGKVPEDVAATSDKIVDWMLDQG